MRYLQTQCIRLNSISYLPCYTELAVNTHWLLNKPLKMRFDARHTWLVSLIGTLRTVSKHLKCMLYCKLWLIIHCVSLVCRLVLWPALHVSIMSDNPAQFRSAVLTSPLLSWRTRQTVHATGNATVSGTLHTEVCVYEILGWWPHGCLHWVTHREPHK